MIKKLPTLEEFGEIICDLILNNSNNRTKLQKKRRKELLKLITGATVGYDIKSYKTYYVIDVCLEVNNNYIEFPITVGSPKISNIEEKEND